MKIYPRSITAIAVDDKEITIGIGDEDCISIDIDGSEVWVLKRDVPDLVQAITNVVAGKPELKWGGERG